MVSIHFTVLGDPQAQKRHRSVSIGGHIRQYDPDEKSKKDLLKLVQEHAPEKPIEGAVRLDIIAFFSRPKSHYRSGSKSHILKDNAPKYKISKPDRDNIDKRIMDALNKIFWKDDGQICCGEVIKLYTETTPRTEVYITEFENV